MKGLLIKVSIFKVIALLASFAVVGCGSSSEEPDPFADNGDPDFCGLPVARTITADDDRTVLSRDERATLIVTANIPTGASLRVAITVLCGFQPPSLNGRGYLVQFTGQIVPQYNLSIDYLADLPPTLNENTLRIGTFDQDFNQGWVELPPVNVVPPSGGTAAGLNLTGSDEIYGIFVAQSGGGGDDNIAPSIPEGVTLSVRGGEIVVQWSASEDNPGGSGVKGYDVFRGLDENSVSSRQISPPPPQPPVAGTSYTDRDVIRGTRYCYAVRSVDNAGNASGLSSIVCASAS